ncbi:MAG: glycosyltransferase family 4 protein [Sphingobacteriaceae bacterium]|nr:glycosyltransferase family 4 protein [Sphingobacteriaceae bacterium]
MKKISYYPRYDRLGASSRLRIYQFLPELIKDYDISVNYLLSNQYVKNIYTKTPQSKWALFKAYCSRLISIIKDDADIIVIEKELFPYLPYIFEKVLLRNKKYIIDIDDAWFHIYDQHSNKLIQKFIGPKIHLLMQYSWYVFAGSPYLFEVAKSDHAKQVILLPTVVDANKYRPNISQPVENLNSIVIGWIGTNGTVKYLDLIFSVLESVAEKLPEVSIVFKVIGATISKKLMNVKVEEIVWSESDEAQQIVLFDIGIMPLENTLWEQGKCAYKLVQYMACGKAVVASNIGANNSVVIHNNTGLLCSDPLEWESAIIRLITDKELRAQYGINGRIRFEQNYSMEQNLIKMKEIFNA